MDDAGNALNATLPTGANIWSTRKDVFVDTTGPTVVSVQSPAGDPTYYNLSDVVPLEITFSEIVTISGGTPSFGVSTGGTATWDGVDNNQLSIDFDYTVGALENSADLDNGAAIALGGGTIADSLGNAMTVFTIPSVGNNLASLENLIIDTTPPSAPTIDHIDSNDGIPSGDIASGGTDNDQTPTLNVTGLTSGFGYTIYRGSCGGTTVASGTAGGELFDETLASQTEATHNFYVSQTDLAGNESSCSAAFAYTIDITRPTVTSIQSSLANAGPHYFNDPDTVNITTYFSESVIVTGLVVSLTLVVQLLQVVVQVLKYFSDLYSR